MRKRWITFAAVALASPAVAEMKRIEPGRYLCAAPAGHAQNQDIVPLQVGEQLRLRVKFEKENFDPRWTVAASVQFVVPKGRMAVVIGRARNEEATKETGYMLVALADPGGVARKVVDRFPANDDWNLVTLKMDANGMVTVRSRTHTEMMDLGTTQISKALLHCHSGEFEFEVSPQSYLPPQVAH